MKYIRIFALCLCLVFVLLVPSFAVDLTQEQVDYVLSTLQDLDDRLSYIESLAGSLVIPDYDTDISELQSAVADLQEAVSLLSGGESESSEPYDDSALWENISLIEDSISDLEERIALVGESAVYVLDDSPEHSDGLPAVIVSLFGEYQPQTQTVAGTEYSSVVPGLAGLDWPWIASVVLFCICIFCVFRLIGGIFKWS